MSVIEIVVQEIACLYSVSEAIGTKYVIYSI